MIRKVVLPHITGETLTDKWSVEFSVFNEKTGKMVRFRKSKGFSKMRTLEEKRAYGLKQVAFWEAKLRTPNYDPFTNGIVFIADTLAYHQGKRKLKETKFDIRHFLNQYFEAKRPDLRVKTYQTYLAKVRIFLSWLENHEQDKIHPRFLTDEMATLFCENLSQKRRVGNKSHNAYLQTMSSIWEYFLKRRIVEYNPWKQVSKKRYISTSQRPFTMEQSEKIVAFLKQTNPWLLFFCEFQYHTLIRPGSEQSQIRISDIDFYTQELVIRAEISKNKKTQRVAIPDQLWLKVKEFKLHDYPGDYFVFGKISPSPEKAGRDHFSKLFRKVLTHLQIGSGWSMYSWKHTMNQRAAMAGIPLKELQIQNRHHSLDQMDEYMKGLTVRDAKSLFTSIPNM
jgi:site-specific recombinase XerD